MNKKEILLLSIGIFLTVVAWLIADIYHASTEEKIKSTINIPSITKYEMNTNLFDKLEKKKE